MSRRVRLRAGLIYPRGTVGALLSFVVAFDERGRAKARMTEALLSFPDAHYELTS